MVVHVVRMQDYVIRGEGFHVLLVSLYLGGLKKTTIRAHQNLVITLIFRHFLLMKVISTIRLGFEREFTPV